MRITHIRFRRLQSHDRGYGHDAVEMEAALDEGEDAEVAFSDLRNQVLARLGTIREVDGLIAGRDRLASQVRDKERDLERLKKHVARGREIVDQYDKLADLARQHQLPIPTETLYELGDGVPF